MLLEELQNPTYNYVSGEIILVNKPYKWTSFNAVSKIKHQLKNHPSLAFENRFLKPKVGHAGTLDPLATGLLVICTGKKTKIIEQIQAQEKEYSGTFYIGATTPCFDLEKEIDARYPTEHITLEFLQNTVSTFLGKQQQTPPLFSAVKVKGERAYDIARRGEEVILKSKEIEIKTFELTRIDFPEVDFKIVCTKGTYIRSIARDLGIALSSGAHLISLCRERIGDYLLKDAILLE